MADRKSTNENQSMKTNSRTINRGLCALALGSAMAAPGAVPVITDTAMVPRFTIHSDLGVTNQIQYSSNLSQTNWVVLTNLLVTQSPYRFVDADAPPAPQRFYRVLALGTNGPVPPGMVLIPAGSFTMGDTLGESDSDELPGHTNYVSAFYVDQYEITKAVWDDVYDWGITHGYSFEHGAEGKGTNHPAQSMTWYDAVKWCNARSEKEGRTPCYYTNASLSQVAIYRSGQLDLSPDGVNWVVSGYRLATEAEWEKAARGGLSGQRFPWGDSISESQANYYGGTADYSYDLGPNGYNALGRLGGAPYTSPAGCFVANGYGLYDMAGNVWEWCWDWHGEYSSGSQTDPHGPASGSLRVFRGSGWYDGAFGCRAAARNYFIPSYRCYDLGFRAVLSSGQ